MYQRMHSARDLQPGGKQHLVSAKQQKDQKDLNAKK
jgi:hypothetical protein